MALNTGQRASGRMLYVADALVWFSAMFLARVFRFQFDLSEINWKAFIGFSLSAAILQILFGTLLALYREPVKTRTSQLNDSLALFVVVVAVGLPLWIIALIFHDAWEVSHIVALFAIPIAFVLMMALRYFTGVFSSRSGSLGGTSVVEADSMNAVLQKSMVSRVWESRYGRKLLATDTLIVLISVFAAQFLRFGLVPENVDFSPLPQEDSTVQYLLVSLGLSFLWLIILEAGHTRDPKVFGIGPTEYKRVVNSTILTFGLFAIFAFATRAQIGRGYILIALPLGIVLLLLSRWLWRKRLHRQRSRNRNTYRTLIVAERNKTIHVAREISRSKYAGFELVGAVTEHGTNTDLLPGLPVVANYDEITEAVDRLNVDTVIITSTDSISPERLRSLGWELQDRCVDLILTAALTDVAGPRIHMRPVSGLPLIYVERPEFSGRKLIEKRFFDVIVSGLLLVVLSPVFLVVALITKLSSKGPVFYMQERIGMNGTPFNMFKFRSMVVGADDQLKSLLDAQGTSDKPLHKIENDPRITPFGRFIRKYSIDELPQIANVFLGTMSLVGPRPQRAAEVALYKNHHGRRLMVKPGITGLWQVSGRSNLEWEDAIRLDLYYVENWSMVGDLILLMRTVQTVLRTEGAF